MLKIEEFHKDVTPHHIKVEPDFQRMAEDIAEALNDPPVPALHEVPLPEAIVRFSESINNKFVKTAENCEQLAEAMRRAAAALDGRAKDLREAAPDVSGHVERWVQFERECNERFVFFKTTFLK